jgi:hypothetical protein
MITTESTETAEYTEIYLDRIYRITTDYNSGLNAESRGRSMCLPRSK